MKKTRKEDPMRRYSFDEVFRKKTPEFTRGYREESARIELAHKIRSERERQKLTQKIVAQKSGMSQSVIARVESGDRGISVDTLGRIAHTLGKEVQLV